MDSSQEQCLDRVMRDMQEHFNSGLIAFRWQEDNTTFASQAQWGDTWGNSQHLAELADGTLGFASCEEPQEHDEQTSEEASL